jgi:hypothetical protein
VLWHLLSLDAPTVATLWTWFIAKANHVRLPASALVAMAAAVWMLYAADRLLDVQGPQPSQLEERHYFHRQYRRGFLAGIVIASMMLAALLPRIAPEAIRLYLVLGGLVFGYFVVIHATATARWLPKEIAVGVCFAAAVFIPTVAREPALRAPLLAPAILFATLCSMNCLFIYAWEHPKASAAVPHPLTAAALRYLSELVTALVVVSAALALFDRRARWQLDAAVALSAAALLALHRRHKGSNTLTMRAAADLTLLTPAVLAWFL